VSGWNGLPIIIIHFQNQQLTNSSIINQHTGAQMKSAVLELNASNERGIDVVREKIKGFAQSKVTLPTNRHKIIILDEADSMTTGAQQALRRTMEIYSSTTRFALACNTSDKIIEPIQSRCAHVRFNKLTEQQIKKRVLQICAKENVEYTEDGIEAILFTAQGDLRQAINNLQSTHDGFGKVNNENVFKVCDEPHPNTVREMLKYCIANQFDDAYKKMKYLWNLGYSSQDIISNIFNVCKTLDMPENLKMEYIKEIGITNLRLNKSIKSLLQFTGLLVRLCKKGQA
jgi:replication factor C subunit 2/4